MILGCLTSQQHARFIDKDGSAQTSVLTDVRKQKMQMYRRDGSAQTVVLIATQKWKMQIEYATSLSHSTLTPGQPLLALTLHHQTLGRIAIRVPTCSLWYDWIRDSGV